MFIEYILGPLCALLLGAGYTKTLERKNQVQIEVLAARVKILENEVELYQQEMPKKILALQLPLAKALKEINQQIGLQ